MAGLLLGVFLVSAGALLYQITLTRIFSIAEWYHYAFLVVSLALLGYGASGTVAARLERSGRRLTAGALGVLAACFGAGTAGSYLAANYIPFDSFLLALDRRQLLLFFAKYLALSVPFFFAGTVIAVAFREMPERCGRIYFASMVGSGAGAVGMPLLAGKVAVEGLVLVAAGLGMLGASALEKGRWRYVAAAGGILLIAASLRVPAWMEVRSSPYKSLHAALLYPGAKVVERKESATARVEVVQSAGTRYAPGLSYLFEGELPKELAIAMDGGNMTGAVIGTGWDFAKYLPGAAAYVVARPKEVVVLRPRGGIELITALVNGAGVQRIVAVEDEPAVAHLQSWRLAPWMRPPTVEVVTSGLRSFLESSKEQFDVVSLPLAEDMGIVRSGAFSLTQEYRLTVEGIAAALERLDEHGVISITRWIQLPPSEEIRALDTVAEALRKRGVKNPAQHIIALRTWVTMTILGKREPFSEEEIASVKRFCAERRFDLVWYPGMKEEEANVYTELPEPVYYRAAREILGEQREKFLEGYDYNVRAVTDDRPFFFDFFKWRQVPELFQKLGREWLPFGGSGYLFMLVSLGAAIVGAVIIMIVPALGRAAAGQTSAGFLSYFAALGAGFIFVEIALMHRFALLLDHPTYSFAAVLGILLGASGLGSLASERLSARGSCITALVTAGAVAAVGLMSERAVDWGLGLSFAARLGVTGAMVAPLGFLMGIPFPSGLRALAKGRPEAIAWAWAGNGAASVVGSVAALMLALEKGYGPAIWIGAAMYAAAFLAWVTLPCGRGGRSGRAPGCST